MKRLATYLVFSLLIINALGLNGCAGGSSGASAGASIPDQKIAIKVSSSTSENTTSGDVMKASLVKGVLVIDAGSGKIAGISRPTVSIPLSKVVGKTVGKHVLSATGDQVWVGQAKYTIANSNYVENYTVTTDASGTVTGIGIDITKDSGNKISLVASATNLPIIPDSLIGQYTITNSITNKKIIIVIDSDGNLYADMDGDLTTVDDIVRTVLFPDSNTLFTASITGAFYNDANADNSFDTGPVTFEFKIITSSGALSGVTFNCYDGGKSVTTIPAQISFIDKNPVRNSTTVPKLGITFDDNSSDLSSHWMNIPNTASWSEDISGVSTGTWNSAGEPLPSGYTGTEKNVLGTRIVTLETTILSEIKCVKWVEKEQIKTDIFGPYNHTPQNPSAVWNVKTKVDYLAKATNGAIYRIAWGEKENTSNLQISAVDPSQISINDNSSSPILAFQAQQPNSNPATPTSSGYNKENWSFVDKEQRTNTQVVTINYSLLSNQTNGAVSGLINFCKNIVTTRNVAGNAYNSHFESVRTEHRYWKPGTGFISADITETGSGTENYSMPSGMPVNGVINQTETHTEIRK